MQSNRLTTSLMAALLAVVVAPVTAQPTATATPPLTSEMMPLVTSRSLILDMTEASARAVAVGERGEILISESRTEWRQVADVPTRSTLTAVSAVGNDVWAVGHDGTILVSHDSGLTWSQQRRDVLDTSPDAVFDPRQGVPLLDVLMLDAKHGFACGAYSQLLRTDDGGANWHFVSTKAGDVDVDADDDLDTYEDDDTAGIGDEDSWTFSDDDLAMDDIAEPHFNAIARTGSGALIIAGERGTVFRSRDNGASWERLQLPYGGSMFGAIGYEGDHVLVFGMRGNAYESHDLGETWEQVDTNTDLSLMGGAGFGNGGFALVGANGIVLTRTDSRSAPKLGIHTNAAHETPVLAGVLVRPNRSLVVAGEKGVDTFTPNSK